MRTCVALLLVVGVAPAADEPEAGAKDKAALEGLWQAVELEHSGRRAPAEAVNAFQIRIKGDQIVFNPATENRKSTFAIDPVAEPKTMALTPADGPAKGNKLPCAIYKLDGDKLTLCIDKEGASGKYPTEFKTAAGDGFALLTLQRVRDKK